MKPAGMLLGALAMCCLAGAAHAKFLDFAPPESREWAGVAFNDADGYGYAEDEKSADSAKMSAKIKCPGICNEAFGIPRGYCVAIARYAKDDKVRYLVAGNRVGRKEALYDVGEACDDRSLSCKVVYDGCYR